MKVSLANLPLFSVDKRQKRKWEYVLLTDIKFTHLPLDKNDRQFFSYDIFKCFFLNENDKMTIQISLKLAPRSPIDNKPALVQVMAWCRTGDNPLGETMNDPVHWRIYAALRRVELTLWILSHCKWLSRIISRNIIILLTWCHLNIFVSWRGPSQMVILMKYRLPSPTWWRIFLLKRMHMYEIYGENYSGVPPTLDIIH